MKASATFTLFLRLLGLGRRYVFWYILLCIITTLLALFNVAIAEILKRLANAAVDQNMDLLIHTVWLTVGVLIINLAASVANKMLSGSLEYRSTLFIQSRLLDKILKLRMTDLDQYHSADMVNRISDSLHQAQHGVNVKSQELLGNVLQIAFVLSYLSFLNIWLTAGALLIAFFLPLLVNLLSKPMRNLYESRQKSIVEKESFIQEVIQGGEVIRSYHLLHRMKNKLKQKYDSIYQSHFKILRYEAALFRTHTFIWMLGVLYAFGCGGYLVFKGRIEVGDVVAFAIAFERFAFPLSGLAGMWSQFQSSIAHGRRVFEIFDLQEEGKQGKSLHFESISRIQFVKVAFAYHESKTILNEITLELKSGRPTALVGPSGSGKSTLAYLLLGFYEPTSGEVLVDNENLRNIDVSEWRKHIAYIPQEPVLFSGSFYENIAVGKPNASMEEVMAAAKSAQIHDDIMRTEQQYDTMIGENGLQLSGGEKQRVVIARALLSNPKVIVFDEPTSSLDAANEKFIFKEFQPFFQNRIILIITHRLPAIRDIGHIVFMERGQVMEQGSHEELLENNGRYCSMYHAGKGEAAG